MQEDDRRRDAEKSRLDVAQEPKFVENAMEKFFLKIIK
jgi:hypothetical protein